ncbi:MAG: hypothetical protein KGN16_13540, partial [Burkholderiales bacterium]|nr:hypothetical protein [Burkholderiales bacterium]
MEELRLSAVASRVVAWHNSHPLARRITRDQVHAVGYVGLPYAGVAGLAGAAATPAAAAGGAGGAGGDEGGGTLRERALARARRQADGVPDPAAAPAAADAAAGAAAGTAPRGKLVPVFSEDFIAPIAPRSVGSWGARHGVMLAQPPGGGPLREVVVDPRLAAAGVPPCRVYVLTAAIEIGSMRTRVLIGRGQSAAVLGPRLWSGRRLAVLALVALGLAAAALALGLGLAARTPAAAPVARAASAAG